MELIIGLIISGLIGLAIGQTRGRPIAGFLLGLLIGPIGWLLVFVGPNPKKKKEEEEKQALVQQQFALQKAQLDALQRMQSQAFQANLQQPQNAAKKVRIAKDGQDLGEIDMPKVKLMLRNGELTQQDYYFDVECNDWMTIECHPDLAR
jgi:hypothetical protein